MVKALGRSASDWTGIRVALGFLALIIVALGASGCNTIEGMGRDVSAAGDAMSNTAGDVKDEM